MSGALTLNTVVKVAEAISELLPEPYNQPLLSVEAPDKVVLYFNLTELYKQNPDLPIRYFEIIKDELRRRKLHILGEVLLEDDTFITVYFSVY